MFKNDQVIEVSICVHSYLIKKNIIKRRKTRLNKMPKTMIN